MSNPPRSMNEIGKFMYAIADDHHSWISVLAELVRENILNSEDARRILELHGGIKEHQAPKELTVISNMLTESGDPIQKAIDLVAHQIITPYEARRLLITIGEQDVKIAEMVTRSAQVDMTKHNEDDNEE